MLKKALLTSCVLFCFGGCYSDPAVEFVKGFLKEKNPDHLLGYVREGSDYLKENNLDSLLRVLQLEYVDIVRSDYSYNEREIVIEVRLEKILVGSKFVFRSFEFFIDSVKGDYKIDLDASMTKSQKYNQILDKSKDSVYFEIRARISPSLLRWKFEIDKKEVKMELSDTKANEYLYVWDDRLKQEFDELLKNRKMIHVILKVRHLFEQIDYWIVDSIVQTGWIKPKNDLFPN